MICKLKDNLIEKEKTTNTIELIFETSSILFSPNLLYTQKH
jgi:hypothetical protein